LEEVPKNEKPDTGAKEELKFIVRGAEAPNEEEFGKAETTEDGGATVEKVEEAVEGELENPPEVPTKPVPNVGTVPGVGTVPDLCEVENKPVPKGVAKGDWLLTELPKLGAVF